MNKKIILPVLLFVCFAFIYQFAITGFTAKTPNLVCTDTDNGENPFEKGITTGFKWNPLSLTGYKQVTYTDKCIPYDKSDKNRVREHYCKDGLIYSKNLACPEGTLCQNGSCI